MAFASLVVLGTIFNSNVPSHLRPHLILVSSVGLFSRLLVGATRQESRPLLHRRRNGRLMKRLHHRRHMHLSMKPEETEFVVPAFASE